MTKLVAICAPYDLPFHSAAFADVIVAYRKAMFSSHSSMGLNSPMLSVPKDFTGRLLC